MFPSLSHTLLIIPPVFSELPKITNIDAASATPEQVLDRRLVKKGNTAIPQVLVKWSRLPDASATWEDYYVLRARFPDAAAAASVGSVISKTG